MLQNLFKPRPSAAAGRTLYHAAAAQARTPDFYLAGVPDTAIGRFELYTLHVVLLLHRMKGQGAQAAETAQALFDTFVSSLDDALRELGVGDLSVGKKMRKLGEAFFGRTRAYDAALSALPHREELEALIGRTVFDGVDAGAAPALTDYVVRAAALLQQTPLGDIVEGRPAWPPYRAEVAPESLP